MPSALEILEKKIAKITTQIESMDKGGGKKRKRVREELLVVAPKKRLKKVARESSPVVLMWREKHAAMLADDRKWEPVERGGDCKRCVKLRIECEKRILGVAVACRACLQLKVGCSWMGGRGKKKVPVEEAPPNNEYEESLEESGSGSGESGESREDKEDEGEVQGPREDPELVGRMKELGESFERVREEMSDKLKGMEKDVKMSTTPSYVINSYPLPMLHKNYGHVFPSLPPDTRLPHLQGHTTLRSKLLRVRYTPLPIRSHVSRFT
ncbi:hypothetical protein FISHEDRAFT_73941 [Fistulina hepatica ATCC 64428]|uniref:Uncharacterized protein n=1 Tax=Fistulina hepatica ATCC 64428 TaxID=1128425 RepID=A0A0D7ABB5_9AGAR|nr:hypothetical protein FISHEDRAFT_73941 [Fistulina hepatica ATCC 64428]